MSEGGNQSKTDHRNPAGAMAGVSGDGATRRPPLSPKAFRQEVVRLYRWMPHARKRQLPLLGVLLAASALADLVTIGSVLPFLTLSFGAGLEAADGPAAGLGAAAVNVLARFDESARERLFLAATLFLISAAILSAAVNALLVRKSQQFVHGLGHDLARAAYSRVLHQPYAEFLRGQSANLLSSLDQVQGLVNGLLLPAIQAVQAGVLSFLIAVFLIAIEPVIALILAGFIALFYGATLALTRARLRKLSGDIGDLFRARIASLQAGLGGIRDIMIDGNQKIFIEDFAGKDRPLRRAWAETGFLSTAPRRVIEAVGIVLIVAATLVVAGRPGGAAAAIPTLGALAVGAQKLLPLIQQIYQARSQFATYGRLLANVNEMALGPDPQYGEAGANRYADAPDTSLRFSRDVVFEAVSFTYPESAAPALYGVDLAIAKGARLGITGPSGSGKSTLVDLLMGLLLPSSGVLRVDGEPLDDARRQAWKRQIAHVPQSVFLTDASIAANVAFGRGDAEIDPVRVKDALDAAGLADVVAGLPDGIETRAGEYGNLLSGGQRQRIGIARALYKQPVLLILDEATSALDAETERGILDQLERLGPEITIVTISHRLEALSRTTAIALMADGQVQRMTHYRALASETARPASGQEEE